MKIAVEGCCHGELDKIYETLQYLEQANGIKVDLLLICGDFQAVRNRDDLKSMAVPQKYQKLNTFHKYYSGEKEAPVLTIFIGGNHEASNFLQELPYGGWVAKNIYYMGYASVVQVKGVRIAGLSGIYKARDYNKGHFECPPYNEDTKRSVYHIRNIEVFRLKQLKQHVDIFMSHDWPTNVAQYGFMPKLFKWKPFLREEVLSGSLGSPPAEELLHKLQPAYWFSAHLHVKYSAQIKHSEQKTTKFLSLDKCLPRRQFLQVLDVQHREEGPVQIKLDAEWLCVLKATNHLFNIRPITTYMPGPGSSERYEFEVTDKDLERMLLDFGGNLTVPENFEHTALPLDQKGPSAASEVLVNPQTTLLCSMLDITDPNAVILGVAPRSSSTPISGNPDEIDLDEDDTDGIVDDEEFPSYINSSLDSSYMNSSLDTSDSFFAPSHVNLLSEITDKAEKSPQQTVEVTDDDEEFKAIIESQRRVSQKIDAAFSSPKRKTLENDEHELTAGISPQRQKCEQSEAGSTSEGATDQEADSERSCLEDDSTSQCSQEAASSESTSQAEISQGSPSGGESDSCISRQTKVLEISTDIALNKRQSPLLLGGDHGGKKLKRRNESFYLSVNEDEAS